MVRKQHCDTTATRNTISKAVKERKGNEEKEDETNESHQGRPAKQNQGRNRAAERDQQRIGIIESSLWPPPSVQTHESFLRPQKASFSISLGFSFLVWRADGGRPKRRHAEGGNLPRERRCRRRWSTAPRATCSSAPTGR